MIKQRAKQNLVELPIVLSDHADWQELTENILNSGATSIYVTHGREDGLVYWCKKHNLKAKALSLVGRDLEGDQ